VIIRDLNPIGIPRTPDKANAPLVVDADAVLPSSIAVQAFETVARRRSQITQNFRGIQLPKFAKRHPLDILKALDRLPSMKLLCFPRTKGLNHMAILYCYALYVKRYTISQGKIMTVSRREVAENHDGDGPAQTHGYRIHGRQR